MIIDNNNCTQIGDTIFFETNPIWGMVRQFSSFSDVVIGETNDRYFDKEFRYSYNGGLIFSQWKKLNQQELVNVFDDWLSQNNNLLSIKLDEQSDLVFQFKYERVGTDNTGNLILDSLKLNGRFLPKDLQYKVTSGTIFSEIINNNIDLFELTKNLTEKIYNKGILPEFVDRREEDKDSLLEDKDFLDLWKTVSEFYAMIFLYTIRFTNIYWKKDLLCEYLSQKGIIICNCDNIVEMQLLSQNFYDEVRSRGTIEIFRPKDYEYFIGNRKSYISNLFCDKINTKFPLFIDGIRYDKEIDLPFGWLLDIEETNNSGQNRFKLISNDNNYHEVLFGYYNGNELIKEKAIEASLQPTEYSGIKKKYNGEYLRLICFSNKCDEFIFNQVNIKDFGFNINNSSPLYKGLDDQYNTIIKAYEYSKDFIQLEKYPWFGYSSSEDDILDPPYCLPIKDLNAYIEDIYCENININNGNIIQ